MTSREIVIDLINRQIIDGEQAFTLINDLLQSEILEAWKALNNKETADLADKNGTLWKYLGSPSITSTPNITWIGGSNTTTACSDKC